MTSSLPTPTFLLCSERSGSNLIRAILNAHSEVFAPLPLHLLLHPGGALWQFGDVRDDHRWQLLVGQVVQKFQLLEGDPGYQLTEQQVLDEVETRSFAALYSYVYARGLQAHGKSRIFLKENHVHRSLAFVLTLFPDAKFVFQVRDPRDYAASCQDVSYLRSHYGTLARAIQIWREDQEGGLRVLHSLPADRLFVQRYEDLVRDPERVLRPLCRFLGIDFEPSMLRYYEDPLLQAAARNKRHWSNLGHPLLTDRVGRYRRRLSRTKVELIEHRLADLMHLLGYSIRHRDGRVLERAALHAYETTSAALGDTWVAACRLTGERDDPYLRLRQEARRAQYPIRMGYRPDGEAE